LQNNYGLEKGLEWATLATSQGFPGDPTSFGALSTKAAILDKMGRSDEAATVIKNALPFGSMGQLQQFGRQLLAAKKPKAALEVFQFNYTKNGAQFVTLNWYDPGDCQRTANMQKLWNGQIRLAAGTK
jgi:hypothetical protein